MAPKWDDVRVFLALERCGSLTDAARDLGLDTSTVSRRLAALEAEVGTALFERSREGVRPTAAAEELLPDAREIEASMRRLGRIAEGLEVLPEGLVRLSVPPAMAESFLVPRLRRLRARHPRLRLEILASAALADLTRREADLALRLLRPRDGELISVRVLTNEYAVFGTPRLATEAKKLDRWNQAPFIAWSSELAQVPAAQWLTRFAPGVEPVLQTNSLTAQVAAAEDGLGLAVLPTLLGRKLVRITGRPATRESLAELPREDVWLVGHAALRQVPRIAAVWNFLREEAAALSAPR